MEKDCDVQGPSVPSVQCPSPPAHPDSGHELAMSQTAFGKMRTVAGLVPPQPPPKLLPTTPHSTSLPKLFPLHPHPTPPPLNLPPPKLSPTSPKQSLLPPLSCGSQFPGQWSRHLLHCPGCGLPRTRLYFFNTASWF